MLFCLPARPLLDLFGGGLLPRIGSMLKLRDLTSGERLLLLRRREHRSQIEMARTLGVTRYHYRLWELDEIEGAPSASLRKLRPYERCFILRRRSGLSQSEAAQEAGVSPNWVCAMEYGEAPSGRLEALWEARGCRAAS